MIKTLQAHHRKTSSDLACHPRGVASQVKELLICHILNFRLSHLALSFSEEDWEREAVVVR